MNNILNVECLMFCGLISCIKSSFSSLLESQGTNPPVVCFSVRISAMHDASRRLQDCLADMYEPEWFGKEEMDALVEVRPGNGLNDAQNSRRVSGDFQLLSPSNNL